MNIAYQLPTSHPLAPPQSTPILPCSPSNYICTPAGNNASASPILLLAPYLFRALGYRRGSGTLRLVTVTLGTSAPFPFWRYGRVLREESVYGGRLKRVVIADIKDDDGMLALYDLACLSAPVRRFDVSCSYTASINYVEQALLGIRHATSGPAIPYTCVTCKLLSYGAFRRERGGESRNTKRHNARKQAKAKILIVRHAS